MPFFMTHYIFSHSPPTGDDFVLVKVALRDYKDALFRSPEGDSFWVSFFYYKASLMRILKSYFCFGGRCYQTSCKFCSNIHGFWSVQMKNLILTFRNVAHYINLYQLSYKFSQHMCRIQNRVRLIIPKDISKLRHKYFEDFWSLQ